MSKLSKIIFTVLGVVVVGGLALVSFGELSRLRMELAAKQQVIARLSAQTEDLQRQVNAVQTDRRQLEGQLADVRQELDTATQELVRLRNSSTEARLQAEELSDTREQLEREVKRLTHERDEAMAQTQQAQQQSTDLERSVTRLRERWKFLDRDYQRLTERVKEMEHSQEAAMQAQAPPPARPGAFGLVATTELAPTAPAMAAPSALRPEAAAQASLNQLPTMDPLTNLAGAIELPPIVVQKGQAWNGFGVQARVIEVNQQHGFVVLDKGVNDGIQIGATFTIVRGGAPVGAVTVVRARPKLAACDVIPARSPGPLQVGDLAVPQSS